MLEQGAMARSAGRGMAMPSRGRRAVAGAFAFDHGERPGVFGDGAKHRAEASNVATLEESANDEGAKRRVVRRETHGGGGGTIATGSGEHEPAMPFAEWRAATCGRYAAVGRASERPGGAAHAASRARSGGGRIGSNGDRERERRRREAPRREARHRARRKINGPIPRRSEEPAQAGGRRAALTRRRDGPECRAGGPCRPGCR